MWEKIIDLGPFRYHPGAILVIEVLKSALDAVGKITHVLLGLLDDAIDSVTVLGWGHILYGGMTGTAWVYPRTISRSHSIDSFPLVC